MALLIKFVKKNPNFDKSFYRAFYVLKLQIIYDSCYYCVIWIYQCLMAVAGKMYWKLIAKILNVKKPLLNIYDSKTQGLLNGYA